ncbi:hypothetical protein [Pseudoalteromonas sp. ESRF-bin5]|uniref:hypothetical protein n=1 Tax=Pseudoalteromonas sp. ESRF-bin5 TaxID=2014532 RepID=UPI002580899D|nr:hypothetical protein [Pseudoalteromonas sp. ESRF-bin5]
MSLFKGISGDLSNADIGWIKDKSASFEYGYKLAAEKLSDGFEKLDTRSKDSLIFPIVFLYRQYIEITLKGIITELDSFLQNDRQDKLLERHKLLNLWDEAEKLYRQFIKKNSIELVFTPAKSSKERCVIKDFNKLDEDSFCFRYATDKRGNETLPSVDYISLNNFKSQISIVIEYMDNITETLAHARDI